MNRKTDPSGPQKFGDGEWLKLWSIIGKQLFDNGNSSWQWVWSAWLIMGKNIWYVLKIGWNLVEKLVHLMLENGWEGAKPSLLGTFLALPKWIHAVAIYDFHAPLFDWRVIPFFDEHKRYTSMTSVFPRRVDSGLSTGLINAVTFPTKMTLSMPATIMAPQMSQSKLSPCIVPVLFMGNPSSWLKKCLT